MWLDTYCTYDFVWYFCKVTNKVPKKVKFYHKFSIVLYQNPSHKYNKYLTT